MASTFTQQAEDVGIPQTEVEDSEEVDPAIPDDATTVIPVIKK